MINCYKILDVPDYADAQTLRKAYIKLAKKHHPDVAKNSDGERFKLISKAYDTLSDPVTKRYHDQKLRYGIELERLQPKPEGERARKPPLTEVEREKRRLYHLRLKLKNDLKYYAKQNEQLPYPYRALGWVVFSLFGWQLVYQNWFVDENSYDHMLSFTGVILFLTGCAGVLSVLYKHFRFQHFTTNKSIPFFRKSVTLCGVLLFTGLLTLPILNSFRKSYHLKHYGTYEVVRFTDATEDKIVTLKFVPKNRIHPIYKHVQLDDSHIVNWNERWVLIKYSVSNPRIVEMVKRTDAYAPPLK